jgi:hypothetical protein
MMGTGGQTVERRQWHCGFEGMRQPRGRPAMPRPSRESRGDSRGDSRLMEFEDFEDFEDFCPSGHRSPSKSRRMIGSGEFSESAS